ncbi:hypothetical protein [Sphingomonas cavernae]|uniref:Uncharacterized protein n=1 Tax=Sphingomonas cavernae TaxID=2320861 RepID=A0A418WQJ7_9SPHN|nr:hypothetical protein [Sphingomonas cavernae]RJF93439.1 hypothetical protein D3876_03645 [Sphingomonas cavernae]
MDSLRGFDGEETIVDHDDSEHSGVETPIAIGADERRMHVRAYNHWASLLSGRAFPSIEDLEPDAVEDFGPNSVLLDFTAGAENPTIAWLGHRLRRECALDESVVSVADVPSRSLLSRLTDHYLQIIANRAPIGFEAEFMSQAGVNTLYRGILMPYSSDGDTIDFIYGVINWKERVDPAIEAELVLEVEQAILSAPRSAGHAPIWADEFGEVEPDADFDADDMQGPDIPVVDADAGLADLLDAARQGADAVRVADGRSRAALYRALSLAYDFALIAAARPQEYAELLEDSGLKAQDRAPMTPIVKLVFGVDYDKTRLTEFAAALAHGHRQGLGVGELLGALERFPGGLKGIVKAERAARASAIRPPRGEVAANQLRQMTPQAIIELDSGEGEFVVLVARRVSKRGLAVLGAVLDDALVERAMLKAAK